MGGGQANSGQATQAAGNANASSKQNLAFASSDQALSQSANKTLLDRASGFLNPNALNVTTPTGAYKLNYEQAVKQTENEGQGNQANIIRQAANNGLGLSSPAIAEMARRTGLDTANLKGQDFTQAVSQQHQDAVNNFWNAAQTFGGVGSSEGGNAVAGTTGAGSTAANVYGTAGQYHANPATSIIGAGLAAGGAVGAGAETCPAEGSLVLMADGSLKAIQNLRKGDRVRAIDGTFDILTADPIPALQEVLEIRTKDFMVRVSKAHWFDRAVCGYVLASEALAEHLMTVNGPQIVHQVTPAETKVQCFDLTLSPSHSYCVEGIWSLG